MNMVVLEQNEILSVTGGESFFKSVGNGISGTVVSFFGDTIHGVLNTIGTLVGMWIGVNNVVPKIPEHHRYYPKFLGGYSQNIVRYGVLVIATAGCSWLGSFIGYTIEKLDR